jgi:hypothetical protein
MLSAAIPEKKDIPGCEIVNRELEQRGLGELARQCDEWIDKYWFPFYDIERGSGRTGIDDSHRRHATFANDTRC